MMEELEIPTNELSNAPGLVSIAATHLDASLVVGQPYHR